MSLHPFTTIPCMSGTMQVAMRDEEGVGRCEVSASARWNPAWCAPPPPRAQTCTTRDRRTETTAPYPSPQRSIQVSPCGHSKVIVAALSCHGLTVQQISAHQFRITMWPCHHPTPLKTTAIRPTHASKRGQACKQMLSLLQLLHDQC